MKTIFLFFSIFLVACGNVTAIPSNELHPDAGNPSTDASSDTQGKGGFGGKQTVMSTGGEGGSSVGTGGEVGIAGHGGQSGVSTGGESGSSDAGNSSDADSKNCSSDGTFCCSSSQILVSGSPNNSQIPNPDGDGNLVWTHPDAGKYTCVDYTCPVNGVCNSNFTLTGGYPGQCPNATPIYEQCPAGSEATGRVPNVVCVSEICVKN